MKNTNNRIVAKCYNCFSIFLNQYLKIYTVSEYLRY